MNKLPQSIYTAEFKAQAVQQAKAQGTSAAARALGLRPADLGQLGSREGCWQAHRPDGLAGHA